MDADANMYSLFLMALINLTRPCLSVQEVHMAETLPFLVNQVYWSISFFFGLQESEGRKTIYFAAFVWSVTIVNKVKTTYEWIGNLAGLGTIKAIWWF